MSISKVLLDADRLASFSCFFIMTPPLTFKLCKKRRLFKACTTIGAYAASLVTKPYLNFCTNSSCRKKTGNKLVSVFSKDD